MKADLPTIYTVNEDGTEQRLETQKLRFEYSTGINVTIQTGWDSQQIVLRGYHGKEEYKPTERAVILCMRSGGCNLITVSPPEFTSPFTR